MILRAKTPKGLSRASYFAAMGLAVLLLPLAPSWARNDEAASVQVRPARPIDSNSEPRALAPADLRANQPVEKGLDTSLAGRITSKVRKDRQVVAPTNERGQDDDDDQENNGGDLAERIENQVKDLISKLAKELGPVGEEARKALQRAVGELQKALGKEDLTGEDVRRALEKSGEELRRSFEQGGPVERELRQALERYSEEVRGAVEGTRKDLERSRQELREAVRSRAEEARQRQRDQVRKAQQERERQRAESAGRNPDGGQTRDELDGARKEVRELDQQLRRATRRLEELQRREARRNLPRRPAGPGTESSVAEPRVSRPAEPAAPRTLAPPAAPATPKARRPAVPPRVPGIERRGAGPPSNSDRRYREIEEKMNQLLKELENLKNEKDEGDRKESSSQRIEPVRPRVRTAF
jgi:small-conductance mechanosensitive channel